jgi:ubiquinone/menaquinone biosynthesis C-methylase UbiE
MPTPERRAKPVGEFYQDRVLPRIIDVALGGQRFARIRNRVASGLEGEVLEVGFGSGLNVPHYPKAVSRVRAVDPALEGRRLAKKRLSACQTQVDFVGTDGQILPLESSSVDHVLVTWTLCSIPDVQGALSEMRRVLRPGGQLHFVEHGRSPDPGVAAWQDRLTPIQARLFGGCHLNRPIDRLVVDAGFRLLKMDNYALGAPKALGYTFEGLAVRD